MFFENVFIEVWSVQELLVYYINIYNVYMVDLILDNYLLKSIKDINGVWIKVIVFIGDKILLFGGIENGILCKMNEFRIYFVINCVFFFCFDLLNEVFIVDKIDVQLDKVICFFINGFKNDIGINKLKLFKIFDWYKKDYVINGENDIIVYVNVYLLKKIKINFNVIIEYFEYDWGLNDIKQLVIFGNMISIIIFVLNEVLIIFVVLNDIVIKVVFYNIFEIIIVDGGSNDNIFSFVEIFLD